MSPALFFQSFFFWGSKEMELKDALFFQLHWQHKANETRRKSSSVVGFLQWENWLASLSLHLTSAYFQGSSAHTDYGNIAIALEKKSRPHAMVQNAKPHASERKEIRSKVSILISGLPQPTSSSLSVLECSTPLFFEFFQASSEKHLEAATKQLNQTQIQGT